MPLSSEINFKLGHYPKTRMNAGCSRLAVCQLCAGFLDSETIESESRLTEDHLRESGRRQLRTRCIGSRLSILTWEVAL